MIYGRKRMHASKLATNIVRYAKHLNPNLKTLEFSITINREELTSDQMLKHLVDIDDERDIAYLKGRIDQREEKIS